jgi:DNA-binding beta-propeller fold protein YncE
MSKQVLCINKRGQHHNPHERIQAIGGVVSGVRWKDSEDTAIANVKRDPQSYYVSVRGHSVWVVLARHNGREYLKTQPDGYSPDNLELRPLPETADLRDRVLVVSFQTVSPWRSSASNSAGGR